MSPRILLVDDHTLFRSGLSMLLTQAGLNVVGQAADGSAALQLAQTVQPDVVLLDLNMPGLSGMATLRGLLQWRPGLAVLLLTVSEDAADLALALKAGARGYLLKNVEVDYLLHAIQRAHAGEPVVAEAMTGKLVQQFLQASVAPKSPGAAQLTPRERDILGCLALGESNKQIARRFDLSESTVKIHMQNLLKKLQLSSRVQAAVYAVEHGVLTPALIAQN